MLLKERSCQGCTRQKEWGCNAELIRRGDPAKGEDDVWAFPAELPQKIDGEESYACPRQPLHRNPRYWSDIYLYYGMYKKGFYPQTGSTMDQSAKAIAIFQILDVVSGECEDELRQRARDQQKPRGDPLVGRRGM
jgi:hypothetical protein